MCNFLKVRKVFKEMFLKTFGMIIFGWKSMIKFLHPLTSYMHPKRFFRNSIKLKKYMFSDVTSLFTQMTLEEHS